MTAQINKKSYSLSTKLLHWLIAGHMIGLIVSGWWIVDLSFYSSWYYLAPTLHKSFGVMVFLMGLLLLLHKFRKASASIRKSHKVRKTSLKVRTFTPLWKLDNDSSLRLYIYDVHWSKCFNI